MTFQIRIPLQVGPTVLEMEVGSVLFILGANGTGKSCLIHRIYADHHQNARRMSAHRQTWFQSGSVSITGQQRRATENSIRDWDSSRESRWLEHGTNERANMAVYDLVDAQNVRARAIAGAVDNNDLDRARVLGKTDAPLKVLNEVLRLSSIPIVISLRGNEELLAQKDGGSEYSIAELSDGERNVLLIASNVLTAKPGTLLLVDEPERHIHRSISSPLLTQLITRRSDCAFVVSTHDVMLPLDNPHSRTLLLRSCSFDPANNTVWDADLLDAPVRLEERLVGDILGARRRVLFVEGTERSLDLPLYRLLFPDVSIVAKENCRDVEQAVTGIRDAENLHWVRAFGIIDNDARGHDDLARLEAKGIFALECYSVESIYYHPEIQKRIAVRHFAVIGGDPQEMIELAKQSALEEIASHKDRLCRRVAEKAIRDSLFKSMPRRDEVASLAPININIDARELVNVELSRIERALDEADLLALIARYPVRETGALSKIASRLGFQSRTQYESAVRRLLQEDMGAVSFVKGLFGALCTHLYGGEPTRSLVNETV